MLRKILLRCWLLTMSIIFMSHVSLAAGLTPLYWYQTESGLEFFRLTEIGNLAGDSNTEGPVPEFLGIVGYVYKKKMPGTVPLYGLTKKGEFGLRYFYTTNFDEVLDKQDKQYWTIIGKTGVLCYVSPKAIPGKTIAARRFRQPKVSGDSKFRFGDKLYQQWKKLPGVKFDLQPMFYIWQKQ